MVCKSNRPVIRNSNTPRSIMRSAPARALIGMSGNSVNSVDGSITAIATGYASVEGRVRLSPDGSRGPGEDKLVPFASQCSRCLMPAHARSLVTEHWNGGWPGEVNRKTKVRADADRPRDELRVYSGNFTKTLWKSLSQISHSADGTHASAGQRRSGSSPQLTQRSASGSP